MCARVPVVGLVATVLIWLAGAQAAQAHERGTGGALVSAPLTSAQSLGVNTASWDGNFLTPDVPSLLERAGIGMLRYPGGSYADYYDWETNTANGQPDSVDWQQFSAIAEQIGATPFVTVNYGSGTPALAAAWVGAASGDPRLADTLWEVGNENYGPWETDDHPDPHTPQSYATYAAAFFEAMHQSDPQAKLGFPYALSPDQAAGTGTGVPNANAWNRTILQQDGDQINFADVHWYPFYGTPTLTSEQILNSVRKIPSVMRSVRETLASEHSQIPVVVGESNISNADIVYNVQPVAALFSAATALEWLSQGAQSFDWWDLHNYGTPQGDYGMLSSGSSGEPPLDTPFPAYYGYQLASLLTAPGSWLQAVPTRSPAVLEFRARRGDQTSLMLINSDSDHGHTVPFGERTAEQPLTTYSYSAADPQVTQRPATGRQFRHGVDLAPESIEVISGGNH
jgi:hypothetical protein